MAQLSIQHRRMPAPGAPPRPRDRGVRGSRWWPRRLGALRWPRATWGMTNSTANPAGSSAQRSPVWL